MTNNKLLFGCNYGIDVCEGCNDCRENYYREKYGMVEDCPNQGDIENDCADCIYTAERHYFNGECRLRRSTQLLLAVYGLFPEGAL